MAACTKIAAFGAMLRLVYVVLPPLEWDIVPTLSAVAVVTMLLGTVVAIVQTDVKRMLAYSAIAHAGFILVGVVALTKSGITGVLFYLLAYGLASRQNTTPVIPLLVSATTPTRMKPACAIAE